MIEECTEKGVKTGVIITDGFADLGTTDRKTAQSALRATALSRGMPLTGPNHKDA